MNRIALISTPWPLFNRPSIQLGTLKASLLEALTHLEVEGHHLYLSTAAELGYDLYREISERTWLSEAAFAGLLYPERLEAVSRFWRRRTTRRPLLRALPFEELSLRLEGISRRILDKQDWHRYILAGFSICFGQLISSLYFIQEVKRRAPSIPVVVGGSACAGEMGKRLLTTFSEIDFVVQGEGERPLGALAAALSAAQSPPLSRIPGLLTRSAPDAENGLDQIPDLDALPVPDYTDYFTRLRALGPDKAFFPRLPMETSRGCWWRKGTGQTGKGCAFCNLNLQWRGYRTKSRERVTREIETLTGRHQILSLSFMDNILPPKGLEDLFRDIAHTGIDLRLFSEIRATTSRETLQLMGAAGMREVQVGIEALSTSLLKRLNKGTTALDNLAVMKHCETPGLPRLTGNLILYFPSSREEDVTETLANLEFAFPFRPMRGIPFWLGYGSPVWQRPRDYRIRRVGNHPDYRHLFPARILGQLKLMIQGYQGGVRRQQRLWKPVREKLDQWRRHYGALHQTPGSGPILSYQDGRDFMIIRERRPGQDHMSHRLTGSSRQVYLFCDMGKSISEIRQRFPKFSEDQLLSFLCMMRDKRLMFSEGERYLSLAVPVRGRPKTDA
jgi:ribosomal peptide maturation radical SAM protein 1